MSDPTELLKDGVIQAPSKALDLRAVRRCYRRYARVYNALFGPSLAAGRHEAIRRMKPLAGERILEIGIGTGLSLDLYPPGVAITGIDLSEEMLARAERRVVQTGRKNVELFRMDAGEMSFPDDSFDKSVAMYVASVTPSPEAMVREMRRVTRPGGQLYIVNHFSRRASLMGLVERLLSPLATVVGFEPLFYLDAFVARCGFGAAKIFKVRPFGYWLVLECPNDK